MPMAIHGEEPTDFLSAASLNNLAGDTHILSKEVRSLARREVVPAARAARPLGRELPKANGLAGHAPRENMSVRPRLVNMTSRYVIICLWIILRLVILEQDKF